MVCNGSDFLGAWPVEPSRLNLSSKSWKEHLTNSHMKTPWPGTPYTANHRSVGHIHPQKPTWSAFQDVHGHFLHLHPNPNRTAMDPRRVGPPYRTAGPSGLEGERLRQSTPGLTAGDGLTQTPSRYLEVSGYLKL